MLNRAPDAECPVCSCPDQVPTSALYRTDTRGKSRRVGLVVRCARCTTEYVAGPSGPYMPKPVTQSRTPGRTNGTDPAPEPQRFDADMPWDRSRT